MIFFQTGLPLKVMFTKNTRNFVRTGVSESNEVEGARIVRTKRTPQNFDLIKIHKSHGCIVMEHVIYLHALCM